MMDLSINISFFYDYLKNDYFYIDKTNFS